MTRRSFSIGLGLAPLVGRSALAQVCTTPCYIGQVANGCFAPDVSTENPLLGYAPVISAPGQPVVTASSLMSRSPHYMKGTPPWIQLILPNWYFAPVNYTVNIQGQLKVLTGRIPVPAQDVRLWAASIEYNGKVVQATFGGSPTKYQNDTALGANGSYTTYAAPGANVTTDPIDIRGLNIPDGVMFYVRLYQSSVAPYNSKAGGIIFTAATSLANQANMSKWGEAVTFSGVSDLTGLQGGQLPTVANQTNNIFVRPLAIVGPTTYPSVALIGDSRMAGWKDNFDSTGDLGEIGRAIGLYNSNGTPKLHYGYTNLGGGQFRAYDFVGGFTLGPANASCSVPPPNPDPCQQQLSNAAFAQQVLLGPASYCSHLVCNLGGNDVLANLSDHEILTLRQQIWALWPKGLSRIATTTIAPSTTSSDGKWLSNSDQTLNPQYSGVIDTLNGEIRALADGVQVFDTAALVEVGGINGTGYWNSDGVTRNLFTADGLHESPHGYQVVSGTTSSGARGAVNAAWFTNTF